MRASCFIHEQCDPNCHRPGQPRLSWTLGLRRRNSEQNQHRQFATFGLYVQGRSTVFPSRSLLQSRAQPVQQRMCWIFHSPSFLTTPTQVKLTDPSQNGFRKDIYRADLRTHVSYTYIDCQNKWKRRWRDLLPRQHRRDYPSAKLLNANRLSHLSSRLLELCGLERQSPTVELAKSKS
jgi:hypothetical protein